MMTIATEIKEFQTPFYRGAWFSFQERMRFRQTLQAYLRKKLEDDSGALEVDNRGPHWRGKKEVNLSYSHTENIAIAIYSETHLIGVDVELKSRSLKEAPLQIAKRFFHPNEVKTLSELSEPRLHAAFLNLWVKKEAYAKLTRAGLKDSIRLEVGAQKIKMECLPFIPIDAIAYIAISSKET